MFTKPLRNILLLMFTIFSATAKPETTIPEVWVVGTIHINHLDLRWGYTLADLTTIIKEIHPDLICGEIFDRDTGTEMEGYYPPENAVIKAVAKAMGVEFLASDWRGPYYDDLAAMQAMTPAERHSFDHAHDELIAAIPFGSSEMIAFYHAKTTQEMVRNAHETRIAAGTEIADGFWYARNQQIVKRCMRRAEAINAKRIAFTYGLEHQYIIEENLNQHYSVMIRAVPLPSKTSNSEMPEHVISDWRQQLEGLRNIQFSASATEEFKDMIQDSSRIKDLEACIQTRGMSQSAMETR